MGDDLQPAIDETAPPDSPKVTARDVRQELTERMVAALDEGVIPWERPWHQLSAGRPRGLASGHEYRGGNRILLMLAQLDKGYADPRFGTFRQINQMGGSVKKGEKGYGIEFWKEQPFWERRDVQTMSVGAPVKVLSAKGHEAVIAGPSYSAHPATLITQAISVHHDGRVLSWDQAQKQLSRRVARTTTVFNVEQCENLQIEKPTPDPAHAFLPNERAERLIAAMLAAGMGLGTDNRGAYYVPREDKAYAPERERFRSVEGYYGTVLHEIGHATGAKHRLARPGITGEHKFGSDEYAREELRAELFSCFLSAETGIPHDVTQHRSYIQSWARILKCDKNEVFHAAAEAEKAIDCVHAAELEYIRIMEREVGLEPEAGKEQQQDPHPRENQLERENSNPPALTASEELSHKEERRRVHERHRGLER